jgi:hypothetical protein
LIRVRTHDGRERAKAEGVRLSRKPKLTEHQRKEAIRRRDKGEESLAEMGPQLQRRRMDNWEARAMTRKTLFGQN